MSWRRGRDGTSWLPIDRIIWAPDNRAHYNHLHVEGYPRPSGTLADCTSQRTAALLEILDALNEFFPGWDSLGIYNCRNIAGTNTPSQHAFSNAVDVGPYYGVGQQQPFFDMLTSPTRPTPPNMEDTMFPLRYQDGWTSGPRPNKRDDVAFLQAMFGLDYGDQQGFYGPTTATDIAAKLGLTDPVNEFGWEQAQLAAEKGIFVGAGYTKAQADGRFARKNHGHSATTTIT